MHPSGPSRIEPRNAPNSDPGFSPGKGLARASETLTSRDGPARNDLMRHVDVVLQVDVALPADVAGPADVADIP